LAAAPVAGGGALATCHDVNKRHLKPNFGTQQDYTHTQGRVCPLIKRLELPPSTLKKSWHVATLQNFWLCGQVWESLYSVCRLVQGYEPCALPLPCGGLCEEKRAVSLAEKDITRARGCA
jgi:hypothetical protein